MACVHTGAKAVLQQCAYGWLSMQAAAPALSVAKNVLSRERKPRAAKVVTSTQPCLALRVLKTGRSASQPSPGHECAEQHTCDSLALRMRC